MPVTRYALSVALISLALMPRIASAQSILEVSTYGATSSYGDTMRKTKSPAVSSPAKRVSLVSGHATKSAKPSAKKTRHK